MDVGKKHNLGLRRPASKSIAFQRHAASALFLAGLSLSWVERERSCFISKRQKVETYSTRVRCVSLNIETMINVLSARAADTALFCKCTFNGPHGFACPTEFPLTTGRHNALGFQMQGNPGLPAVLLTALLFDFFGAIFLSPTWRVDRDDTSLSVVKTRNCSQRNWWKLISITICSLPLANAFMYLTSVFSYVEWE